LRKKKIACVFLRRWLLLGIVMALPLASWYFLITIKNGTFYNSELETYKYGIWNYSTGFLGAVCEMVGGVASIIKNFLTKNLYIFLPGVVAGFFLWRKNLADKNILIISLSLPVFFIIFFSFLTFYPDRVLLAAVLPLLLPVAIWVERKFSAGRTALVSLVFLLGWIVWMCLLGIGLR
jgi:hypothetical protein